MKRFFLGRLPILLSIACAAEMGLESTRYAAAAAMAAVQPDESWDVPAGSIVVEDPRYAVGTSDGPAESSEAATGTSDGPVADGPYNCERRATIADTISDCEEVKKKRGGGWWKILLGIAVAGLLAYILSRTVFRSGNNGPAAEQALLNDGPELPVSYPDGSLSIQAFTQNGWPVVVDFLPQPGTVTALDVKVGKRTQSIVLDPDGSKGRQLVTVRVEGLKANRPTPATYEVKSVPIAAFDVEQPRAVGLAPLKIFGIGGGPSAVGSVAIEQVAFTPAQPGARFRFSTKSQFHRLRAQVQQLNQQGGTISIRPVFDARKSNLGIGPKQGTWNGTIAGTPNPSFGKHRFQITGWFTSDDRSWVAALAPDLVTQ